MILSYVKGFFKHTENLEFKIDFFCPNSSNHFLHIAEFNKEDPSQIKCENFLCQGQVIPVEENYAAWLTCENEEVRIYIHIIVYQGWIQIFQRVVLNCM